MVARLIGALVVFLAIAHGEHLTDPSDGADEEACEMQQTLLQTAAGIRKVKAHVGVSAEAASEENQGAHSSTGETARSSVPAAVSEGASLSSEAMGTASVAASASSGAAGLTEPGASGDASQSALASHIALGTGGHLEAASGNEQIPTATPQGRASFWAVDHRGQRLVDGVNMTFGFRAAEQLQYELVLQQAPRIANKIYMALNMLTFLTCCGADRCMMGQCCLGTVKGITLGGLGVWFLIDHIVMTINMLAMSPAIDVLGFEAAWEPGTITLAFVINLVQTLILCVVIGSAVLTRNKPEDAKKPPPEDAKEPPPEDAKDSLPEEVKDKETDA